MKGANQCPTSELSKSTRSSLFKKIQKSGSGNQRRISVCVVTRILHLILLSEQSTVQPVDKTGKLARSFYRVIFTLSSIFICRYLCLIYQILSPGRGISEPYDTKAGSTRSSLWFCFPSLHFLTPVTDGQQLRRCCSGLTVLINSLRAGR